MNEVKLTSVKVITELYKKFKNSHEKLRSHKKLLNIEKYPF